MGNRLNLKHSLTGTELLAWIFRRRERFNVRGLSMLPYIQPNQDVLLQPLARIGQLHPGDIIVCQDPRELKRLLIKAVASVEDEGIQVRGTNPTHSTDSRHFGVVPLELVKGKITTVLG